MLKKNNLFLKYIPDDNFKMGKTQVPGSKSLVQIIKTNRYA